MYLSGSANNSYGGDTSVNAGTLLLAKPDAITAVPGFLLVGEINGGGAAATARNLASYQVFSGGLLLIRKASMTSTAFKKTRTIWD